MRSILLLLFAVTAMIAKAADDDDTSEVSQSQMTKNEAAQIFDNLIGKWTGTCRTWFEPGKLADESPIEGEFQRVLDADFLRHQYVSTTKGKKRTGEDTLIFNPIKKKFESSWIDSFHMNYAIMFSEGDATEDGFFVLGSYDVAPDLPRWGWKTVYQLNDNDHLTIIAFNISPDEEEAKAVEVRYTRSD